MIDWLRREAIYLWYYLDIQVRQIAPYWALGILLGSAVSVFGKRYIHGAFAKIGQRTAGTIFEVEIAGLASSCGGGGRYDEMVGKFTNMQTPAVGISLGFERLITILSEQGFRVPGAAEKTAILVDKKVAGEALTAVLKEAADLRAGGRTVLVAKMAKNKKFQKEQLTADGYEEIREVYAD